MTMLGGTSKYYDRSRNLMAHLGPSHITHQVLALWAFGAHQDLLHGSYDKNIPLQRLKPEIIEVITSSNFNDHLGDKTYV